ncbi:hypothetical protein BH24DEI1_BH24DEI1_00460 [soil metagenome]
MQVSFSVIPRRRMHEVLEIVRRMNPKAFVTFEEVRSLNVGPPQEALLRKSRV